MEAENYLANGYGQKLALLARVGRECTLGHSASVWQPNRLKGITVASSHGTPFLAATQAYDLRPIPRKFLALEKTERSSDRFVVPGTILVTCSGSVGRATLSTIALSGVLISHDLLRVKPIEPNFWGWIYAYLRSSIARSMMMSAKYGHIIKHLEPSHLAELPMPKPSGLIAKKFYDCAALVLSNRNRAVRLMNQAETTYESHVEIPKSLSSGETGFTVRASAMMSSRRRIEAIFHNPTVRALRGHFEARKLRLTSLSDAGFDVWLPTRFRRVPAEEGVQLVGSADLFEINPDLTKRIADGDFGDRNLGRVKSGWLLLARSGQTYGLNGTLAMVNKFHEGKVISDHVIRIAPNDRCDARAGYIYTALSHPILGRPMVKALAYGSSIPEIEVDDIKLLPIPRLSSSAEGNIADLAEEGARLFAEADILEQRMALEVDRLLEGLLRGDRSAFV